MIFEIEASLYASNSDINNHICKSEIGLGILIEDTFKVN